MTWLSFLLITIKYLSAYQQWTFKRWPPTSTWLLSSSSATQCSSVQSLSHVRFLATPWTIAHQASLSITNSRSLPKLMSIESVMPSSHLILCRPLFLLPSVFPSVRVFSNESNLHIRWPKYWSFSFNISPSNDYSGLIFFKMDWLDLFAVQGTLKRLIQHCRFKSINSSVLSYSPTLRQYITGKNPYIYIHIYIYIYIHI